MAKKFSGDLIHNLVVGTSNINPVVEDNTITTESNNESSNTTNSNTTTKSSKKKTNENDRMRTSYIISKRLNLKLKFISLKEGRNICDMVEEALTNLVNDWEKTNGKTPEL